jgi:glucose-6-phosphate 1-dehydrogenase
MTSVVIPVNPFDLVIFGATGDLAMRKLLPALFRRHAVAQIPENARIIGLSLSKHSTEDYRGLATKALEKHIPADELDPELLSSFLERVFYIPNDVTDPEGWTELVDMLDQFPDRIRVYYLAVSPTFFGVIAHGLSNAGLSDGEARLVVEKPLGHDLKSAQQLNSEIGAVFTERCIYRIDHYLGKETVQNLMALRFANALFEPIWNAQSIDHVQITAAESRGVGTRGGYYDNSGAMRDMVQNHLMQLICLIAMEPPHDFNANAVRDEKLKVLRALKPIKGFDALNKTVRAQYLAGPDSPSYVDEAKNPDSTTECYVAIEAEIENWRWAGVPFFLRTGKKLRSQVTEIAIVFKKPPHLVFGNLSTPISNNVLSIRLQPDEGLELELMTKEPGPGGFRLHPTPLDVAFADAQDTGRMPDAYERLLMDVVRGDQTLFMRGDEVEAAWEWIDPIMDGWEKSGTKPETYDSNSEGPTASVEMMARSGRRWRKI